MAAMVLLAALPTLASANAGKTSAELDKSAVEKGSIGIRLGKTDAIVKAKVTKGSASYTYTLTPNQAGRTFWLPTQMGDGEYEIAVLENVSGNKYRAILSEKVAVKVAKVTDVYLNSVLNLDWQDADKAQAKAKELTRGIESDEQKAKLIYNYIVESVRYDKELARTVTSDYVPDIDATLKSGKAICYGYATLYAAMLRSSGIPAKLAMGNSKLVDEYHAWNEIYLDGKWVIVDTTVDAGLAKGNKKITFEKKSSDYDAIKYY